MILFALSSFSVSANINLEGLEFESLQNDLVIDSVRHKFTKSSSMSNRVRAYDPINRKHYQKVLLGPVSKNRNIFKRDYTHTRYVTVYNIENQIERVAYLPFIEEDCYDDSFYLASWGESRTLSVRLESSVGVKGLGLSASVGASITEGSKFSTSRRIKATGNIKARHYPFKVSDTHSGVTYIQTYNSKTGAYGFLRGRGFPTPFKLDNQNLGFKVVRKILGRCSH